MNIKTSGAVQYAWATQTPYASVAEHGNREHGNRKRFIAKKLHLTDSPHCQT